MIQGIYCIENSRSGRKYFGSSKNVAGRLRSHRDALERSIHHNIQLQRSVNKYGIDLFKFYLIEETHFNTKQELFDYEQTFIDSNINGYNMAPANGGDILSNHPYKDDIREKILQSHKKMIDSLSEEERKLKWGRTGCENPNWKDGGVSHKLCPMCNLTKIRDISNSCSSCRDRTGKYNPFYGKHHSNKSKKKMSESSSGDNSWIKGIDPSLLPYTKKYQIVYPDGTVKEVTGLKIIANEFNVSIPNVHATIARIKKGNIPKRGVFSNITIKQID